MVRIAAGIAVAIAIFLVARSAGGYIPVFAAWVNGLGVWGPLVFIAGYVVAAVGLLPAFLLTLAAGAIFGVAWGTAYVFIGAAIGSAAAFLISRYVARGMVERRIAGNKRFAAIDRAVGEQGRKIVFLLRLSPAFPFGLLNYGLGLTRIGFVDYIVAAPGMIPGILLYVYSGKIAGDVAALAGGATVEKGTGYYVVLTIGLVATVLATMVVTRTARRALDEATRT